MGSASFYRYIPLHTATWRYMPLQELMDRQHFIQSMYETRIASLHRFVAFLVMCATARNGT